MMILGRFTTIQRLRRLALAAVVASASILMTANGAPALAAPAIFYTDIVSGPNTGGEGNNGAYLTLFGTGFGATQGTSTVTVGGGAVAAYKVWSDTKVSVQLGALAATGNIVINTAAGSATAADSFTVRPGKFFFVSLTGNDSTGVVNDITHPFASPNYVNGLSAFVPGDFIVVRGGTYSLGSGSPEVSFGSWWRVNKSGTANNPLTFMGYPGEDVVMKTDSQVSLVGTTSQTTVSYFVVANFKVWINHCQSGNVAAIGAPRGTDSACVGQVRATDARLINWDIDGKDTGGMCSGFGDNIFEVGYSDRVRVLGMSVHNTSPAVSNEASHILYSTAAQTGTEWAYNHVYNIPRSRATIQIHTDNTGGNCYGFKKLTDISIHHNLLHNIAGQAILLDGGTGDISIYDNVIYNAPMPSPNMYEDVIALRGSGGQLNATIFNNTVYTNPNDTSIGWMLGIGSVDYPPLPCPQSVTLRNNIFFVTEGQDRYFQTQNACTASVNTIVTSTNNVWFGSNLGLPSFSGANDISLDPQFVGAQVANFQLTSPGSPAIDAGNSTAAISTLVKTDAIGVPRPQGSAYDIGAFESLGAAGLAAPQNVRIVKQ